MFVLLFIYTWKFIRKCYTHIYIYIYNQKAYSVGEYELLTPRHRKWITTETGCSDALNRKRLHSWDMWCEDEINSPLEVAVCLWAHRKCLCVGTGTGNDDDGGHVGEQLNELVVPAGGLIDVHQLRTGWKPGLQSESTTIRWVLHHVCLKIICITRWKHSLHSQNTDPKYVA